MAQALGVPAVPGGLSRWVFNRVEGHPFFSEELALALDQLALGEPVPDGEGQFAQDDLTPEGLVALDQDLAKDAARAGVEREADVGGEGRRGEVRLVLGLEGVDGLFQREVSARLAGWLPAGCAVRTPTRHMSKVPTAVSRRGRAVGEFMVAR